MPNPDDPTPSRWTRVLIAFVITAAVIAFIALHVTGVLGSGSH